MSTGASCHIAEPPGKADIHHPGTIPIYSLMPAGGYMRCFQLQYFPSSLAGTQEAVYTLSHVESVR